MQEDIKIQAQDGMILSANLYLADKPQGTVMIVHGAKEHKERYADLAEFLQSNGLSVIIADHRGHGVSVSEQNPLGHMGTLHQMEEDLWAVYSEIKKRFSDLPLFLLAHSMGSVFARCFLTDYSVDVQGLILSGTANYNNAAPLGVSIGKLLQAFSGEMGHSGFLMKLGDGDDDSWVCSNEEIMQEYRADPLCSGYKYTNQSVLTIWQADIHMIAKRARDLPNYPPVLSISGERDPVTGGSKGLEDSFRYLRKQGAPEIKNIVYPDMLHEVLNETGKEKVWNDLLQWIKERL